MSLLLVSPPRLPTHLHVGLAQPDDALGIYCLTTLCHCKDDLHDSLLLFGPSTGTTRVGMMAELVISIVKNIRIGSWLVYVLFFACLCIFHSTSVCFICMCASV